MAKKKNKKLPQIGVLGYLSLDELFDYIFMYMNENIESDDDYKKMAEYLLSLGGDENWKLENAYFKKVAENIKDTYPQSYKKLMDFIKEFETEELKFWQKITYILKNEKYIDVERIVNEGISYQCDEKFH